MRHLDAIFSRWTVAGILLVSPLAIGCGAKTDAVPDPLASGDGQPVAQQEVTAEPELGAQQQTDEPAPATPEADSAIGSGISVGQGEATTIGSADDDGSDQAPRPKSLFRSIGRALQKGVTDATSGTGDSPNGDASDTDSESVEREPPDAP